MRIKLSHLGCQVLSLGPLHVVEDEEESLCGEALKEVDRVVPRRWSLTINNE
jgi:hypothetical protein